MKIKNFSFDYFILITPINPISFHFGNGTFLTCQNDFNIWISFSSTDELVFDGLVKTMASSIGYLLDETDTNLTQGVLFEVRLELSEPDVIFVPPLGK